MKVTYLEIMEEAIEGAIGCYTAVWKDWPVYDLVKMYAYVLETNPHLTCKVPVDLLSEVLNSKN